MLHALKVWGFFCFFFQHIDKSFQTRMNSNSYFLVILGGKMTDFVFLRNKMQKHISRCSKTIFMFRNLYSVFMIFKGVLITKIAQ